MADTDVKIKEVVATMNATPKTVISSPKHKSDFTVKQCVGGFIFYEVSLDKGILPKELSGQYTSMKDGVKAVVKYIENAKMTNAAKSEYFKEKRAKREANA